MSELYNRIEELGKTAGYKNITMLCKAAGVSRSVMSELNSGRSKDLSNQNAQKFADTLGTSLDSIYGTERKEIVPAFTAKDRLDVARAVERIMGNLECSDDLMFDGVPMSSAAKESLTAAMKLGLEAARLKNNETNTPKRH
ncbi:MAG: helix-turn-helix transcriptional regulator [Intestinimonas sp.]|jgi:transcriptional regulator with XRE-family HTH domain|nr:helix-turn-helix transcriptional regulator [Intestinimonas sp.]